MASEISLSDVAEAAWNEPAQALVAKSLEGGFALGIVVCELNVAAHAILKSIRQISVDSAKRPTSVNRCRSWGYANLGGFKSVWVAWVDTYSP